MQNDFFHIQTTIDRDVDITIIIFDNFALNLENTSLPKNAYICENPFINIFGCLVCVLNKKNIKNLNFHISSIFNAPFCLCHVWDKIYPIIDINVLTVCAVFFFCWTLYI